MWLSLFAHQQTNNNTLYSLHICTAKEDRDAGGMESRPAQAWDSLRGSLMDAGIESRVVAELKTWLDKDPLTPVQVEVTEDQVNRLGLPTARTQ
jgi:hypothetical protein